MNKLITSSTKTKNWLSLIRAEIGKKCPTLIYKESAYYAPFYCPEKKRNIAYLNPQKKQIRLFLEMTPSFDSRLQNTPSSFGFAKGYPSIYLIKDENMIEEAIELIICSHNHIRQF